MDLTAVQASLSAHPAGEPIALALANKYYVAAVELWLHDVACEGARPGGASPEGCITVLPMESPIDAHTESLGELARAADIAVRLAVAVKGVPGDGEVDGWRTRRVEWCLDNGFEYVEVDFSNITEGWDSREKDGLPRVVEALEMNTWTTMERRAPDAAAKKPSAIEEGASSSSYQPPSVPDATVEETPAHAVATDAPKPSSGHIAAKESVDQKDEVEKLLPTDLDDTQDDQAWNVFSKFIEEARMVRDTAHQGGISDEERRKRAADMATRFAEMMLPPGEMDSSDDDN